MSIQFHNPTSVVAADGISPAEAHWLLRDRRADRMVHEVAYEWVTFELAAGYLPAGAPRTKEDVLRVLQLHDVPRPSSLIAWGRLTAKLAIGSLREAERARSALRAHRRALRRST